MRSLLRVLATVLVFAVVIGTMMVAAPTGTAVAATPGVFSVLPIPTHADAPSAAGRSMVDPCPPGPAQSSCRSAGGTAASPTTTPRCTGPGCSPSDTAAPAAPTTPPAASSPIPQPAPSQAPPAPSSASPLATAAGNAIGGFFRALVVAAINPMLDLLGHTLLTTPTPDSLPGVSELWEGSWQILLAAYALLVLIAGVLLMGYQTVQTRYSLREIAPRVAIGFLAGAMSLTVATLAIQLANALTQAIMGAGVNPASASAALAGLITGALGDGGLFVTFLALFVGIMLVALLLAYVVRVLLTAVLVAAAPLALMAHALPHTEGIARWWWKALGACLLIQVAQSMTLVIAVRLLLTPQGYSVFGPTPQGWVNLLVAIALLYVLVKIPFWCLRAVRGGGGGRSFIGSLVRAFIAYKTFGLIGGKGGRPRRGRSGGGNRGGGGDLGGGQVDPYARTPVTASGQYMLPFGVQRVPRRPKPEPTAGPIPRSRPADTGRQLSFPLDGEWPENKPVLGRDGQYRLPINAPRRAPSGRSSQPARVPRGRPADAGRQLSFPLDGEWPENKPVLGRDGQYRLPIHVTRRASSTQRPQPASLPGGNVRSARPRAVQQRLPFNPSTGAITGPGSIDPYRGNRPRRDGQYPIPLVPAPVRVPRTTSTTGAAPPSLAAPQQAAATSPTPATGQRRARHPKPVQLPLPLDLPHPPPPTAPPSTAARPGPARGAKPRQRRAAPPATRPRPEESS